jgi:hypothetical protein
MRKLFVILIIIFTFFGCIENEKNVKEETKTIIQEDNSGKSGYKLINKKIYPEVQTVFKFPSFSRCAYAGNGNGYIDVDKTTKDANFIAGIFYFDNSYNSNDPDYYHVWRTLDLSAQVGNQTCKVTMYIKVIDCGEDGENEYAKFQFKSPDGILLPVEVSQKYGDTSYYSVQVTTDEYGCIQWAYFGNNAYNQVFENHDPNVNFYQWLECEIWIYEKWKSDVI